MITGTVTKLVKDRGFGFIMADDRNQLYFFHYSAIDPRSQQKIDDYNIGDKVTFESEPTDKGPRARPRTLKVITNNQHSNAVQAAS